jgi:hypothetical protein
MNAPSSRPPMQDIARRSGAPLLPGHAQSGPLPASLLPTGRAVGQRPPPPRLAAGRAAPVMPGQDVWRVDPARSVVCADARLEDAVIVVVEPVASFTNALEPVCAFLGVGVLRVERQADLGALLRGCRPIALFSEVGPVDCQVYDLLMAVADYDTTLPMLMILDNDPAARGALDAASRLWQLTEFVCAVERPGIRALLDFLFAAGAHARLRQVAGEAD